MFRLNLCQLLLQGDEKLGQSKYCTSNPPQKTILSAIRAAVSGNTGTLDLFNTGCESQQHNDVNASYSVDFHSMNTNASLHRQLTV